MTKFSRVSNNTLFATVIVGIVAGIVAILTPTSPFSYEADAEGAVLINTIAAFVGVITMWYLAFLERDSGEPVGFWAKLLLLLCSLAATMSLWIPIIYVNHPYLWTGLVGVILISNCVGAAKLDRL